MRRILAVPSLVLFLLEIAFVFLVAFFPALVYFLAVIRVQEGHVVMLYQSTVTVATVRLLFLLFLPGYEGPKHMYRLDTLCLLLAALSAAALYNKGAPQCLNNYVTSAFASGGGSRCKKWMKFYSVLLVYVAFGPLLLIIIGYDSVGCCPELAGLGLGFIFLYAMVCTTCTATESLRKSACNGADASAAFRRELDRHMNEVAPEEERENLV